MLRIVEDAVSLTDVTMLHGWALPALIMDAAVRNLMVSLPYYYYGDGGVDGDDEWIASDGMGSFHYHLNHGEFGG